MKRLVLRVGISVVSVAFVSAFLLLEPGLLGDRPSCQIIQEWVESQRADLPTSYDELSAFPYTFRVRIFSALSALQRREFFRTHLVRYMEQHPELSDERQQLLAEAVQALGLHGFPTIQESIDRDWITQFRTRAGLVFSPDEVHALFETLGPTNSSIPSNLTALRVRVNSFLRSVFVVKAQEQGCICVHNIWCQWNEWGNCDIGVCDETEFGCGFFGGGPCIGGCEFYEEEE